MPNFSERLRRSSQFFASYTRICHVVAIVALVGLTGCNSTISNRGADGADGADVDGAVTEYWEAHYLRDAKVGHGHTSIRSVADGDRLLLQIDTRIQLSTTRAGQTSEQQMRLTSVETPDGELVRFEMETSQGPTPITTRGEVFGDRLKLTTSVAGRQQESTIEWSSNIKSAAALDRLLDEEPLEPGQRRKFKVFDPTLQQVAQVELTAKDQESTKLIDDQRNLLRIEQEMRLADGTVIESVMWADDGGRVLKSEVPAMQAQTFRTTPEQALSPSSGRGLDFIDDLIVPVAHPLPRPHDMRFARYRVRVAGGNPATVFANSPEQEVNSTAEHLAEITVRATVPLYGVGTQQAVADDLAPNSHIQSDDPLIVEQAQAAAGDLDDPWQIAVALEEHVHMSMTKVDFSHAFATAADVARSHQGDCTEHAVYLAALCRARKIPSRVATGLVYVEPKQGFGFHMWTEVFLRGQWIGLDATLGHGGIGAAHLKLTDTNLKDGSAYSSFLPVIQVLGRLKIEVLQPAP